MGYPGAAKAAVWRFLGTALNFVASVVVFYNQRLLIQASIQEVHPDRADAEYALLRARFLGVWGFSLVCFGVQILGLFSGLTLGFKAINAVDAWLHGLGSLVHVWAVADAWSVQSYFVSASLFVILPATFDVGVLGYRLLRLQGRELFV